MEQKNSPRKGSPIRCYHATTPTGSKSPSTTTAWWPMPACFFLPPSPGAWACGNSSTVTSTSAARRGGPTRGQAADAGRFRAGRRRLHRRRRCAVCRWDGRFSRLRGQGAIHPRDLPAQLSLGPRPSTRPREPPVAGTGMASRGRTRRCAFDHRPGFDHLRNLRHGQGGGTPPRLYRRPWLSPTAGYRRRHRRRVDVPAARGPRQHRPRRRPLPA